MKEFMTPIGKGAGWAS